MLVLLKIAKVLMKLNVRQLHIMKLVTLSSDSSFHILIKFKRLLSFHVEELVAMS